MGSHSRHDHVSRGPPIIPDGRISRVRFETLAFVHEPSHDTARFKRWFACPSSCHGLLIASPPLSCPGVTLGFIKPSPGRKFWKPPSVLSPFAQGRAFLPWGGLNTSSKGVTPSSSLIRTHASIPLDSPLLRLISLVRGVFAGYYQTLLPTGFSRR